MPLVPKALAHDYIGDDPYLGRYDDEEKTLDRGDSATSLAAINATAHVSAHVRGHQLSRTDGKDKGKTRIHGG